MRKAVLAEAVSGDWPTKALGELLSEPLRNGHSAKRSSSGNIRVLTLRAVTLGDFGEQNTKLTAANDKRVADLWIQPGDIFIERSNTPELVGTARLYRGAPNFAIFPDLLIRVRVAKLILPEYLEFFLQSDGARRYFQTEAKGISGTMPKIDQGCVAALRVPVPSLEIQSSIISDTQQRWSILDSLAGTIGHSLTRSARLRRSILQQAFTGQLVAQDPNDEPASELLARISARLEETQTSRAPRPRKTRAKAH